MKKIGYTLFSLASLTAAHSVLAFEKGEILLRGGLAVVSPNDSTSNIVVASDLGVDLSIENNTQLGLTVAYFFNDRMNVEVLAATPFKHQVNFGVSDPLGTGDKLGDVTHLPPTVFVNYYFNEATSQFQPYVGSGLNYTFIFDEKFTPANDAAGLSDLSLDNSFGLAAQVGADYLLTDKWFVNAAVRWIDIDTRARFTLNGTDGSVDDIQIDPWVYTLSLGYRF
ncbi:MAG: outer membrane beta-barrel protein [Paraglaciecola sp.]|uniref:OmpW/AlkL family protein n=1 Tax=Paraglaciecola sp. TaxID=1920173 RepID=UPI00273F647A|nr:OmpW family outer membrane protein [Paraglaciecola sp.]MDP5033077.1 outer membrane beta-barrel protein [Paraglaciecola sp.]MDP5130341.1 outer membrane beta-barrel protein [Paraglaciecola sp.]